MNIKNNNIGFCVSMKSNRMALTINAPVRGTVCSDPTFDASRSDFSVPFLVSSIVVLPGCQAFSLG